MKKSKIQVENIYLSAGKANSAAAFREKIVRLISKRPDREEAALRTKNNES